MEVGKMIVRTLGCVFVVASLSGCGNTETYTSVTSANAQMRIKVLVKGRTVTVVPDTTKEDVLANASAFAINPQTQQGMNSMFFGKPKTTFESLEPGVYDVWVSVMEFGGQGAGSRQASGKVRVTVK